MAGILGYDPATIQGGILGAATPQMASWQQPLGIFSSALKDVGAYLSGHPADANSVQQYGQQMQHYQMQQGAMQAVQAAQSSDPATSQQGYAAMVALGMDPTPIQKLKANSALPQLMQNLQPSMGFNDNPVGVTPAVNAAGPGVDAARAAAMQTNAAPAMSMQPATLSGALQRTGSPELTADMAPQLIQQQAQIAAKSVRQASAAEKVAGGYKPTDPVFIDAYGNLSSEVKPQAAIDQTATMPLTPFQKAQLAHEYAQIGETTRHNKAEENIALNPLGLGMGGATNDQNANLSGDAYLKTLPPGIASTVKAIGDGRMAPVSGFALAKPQGMAIMAAVNKYNPTYDATAMPTRLAARKSFINGADGKALTAINTAVDHLDTLGSLATALGNGDVQTVNRIGQAVSQEFGGSAPTNFDTAKQVVGDEIVKALVGTGGSQSDREEAQKVISRANSPQQLAGAIQTYQKLLAGKLGPLRQKYETNTKLPDFNDQLTPNTAAVLGSLPQGGVSKPAPSPQDLPRKAAVVKTDADYNALPSGTVFTGPDGKQRRKP